MAVFAIAAAPNTIAQGDVPSSRVVLLPDGPTWTALLENALTTAASQYDPKLPAISLEQWLWLTLAPVVEVPHGRLVDWRMLPCSDPRGETGDVYSNLCAMGTVKLSADRNIQILISVARADRSARTGPVPLLPTPPSLRDVYIERMDGLAPIDSFDVPTLSDLPQQLKTPFEQWPTVDFEITTTWTPLNPVPGDTVRFSISVRNTGKRSADRAGVLILISRCCSKANEVRHESLQYLEAGRAVRLEVAIPLPDGMAMVFVRVKPGPSYKIVRESDPNKAASETPVGYPMIMMSLPAPVITVSCSNATILASSSCVISATLSGTPVPSANITITAWDWGDGTTGATGTGAGFVNQSRTYATPRAGRYRVIVSATVPGGGGVGTGTDTAVVQ